MKRDMVKRSPELKRDNSPSPHSYPQRETNWTSLSHHEKVKKYTFKKDKSHYLDYALREKKKVPGVGTHKGTEMAQWKNLSHGTSSPHRRL